MPNQGRPASTPAPTLATCRLCGATCSSGSGLLCDSCNDFARAVTVPRVRSHRAYEVPDLSGALERDSSNRSNA